MTDILARLDEIWHGLDGAYQTLEVDERISLLLRSSSVSHRFAIITQLAGVYEDPRRNAFSLQKGDGSDGSWDPRTFATGVIVPWLNTHMQPLGNSSDPYVSKPLRRPFVEPSPEGVRRSTLPLWSALHGLMSDIAGDPDRTERYLRQAIAVTRRLVDEQDQPFELPESMSPQLVLAACEEFLSEKSGGDRGLAITSAAFSALVGPLIGISRVERHAINAADIATRTGGDVTCFDREGGIVLIAEVKERSLTYSDVTDSMRKIRDIYVSKYLFASPRIEAVDIEDAEDQAEKAFQRGTSVNFVPILDLVRVGLAISPNDLSIKFVRDVEASLSKHNTQPQNRTRWREILGDLI